MYVLETKNLFDQHFELKFLKNERIRRYSKMLAPVCATILRVIYLLSMILNLVFEERENFNKASITFGAISAFSAMALIHWHLFINLERYYTLLNDMQQIVNDKCKRIIYFISLKEPPYLVPFRHCTTNSGRLGCT